MKPSLCLTTCALVALVSGQLKAQKPEPPMLGPHMARGEAHDNGNKGGNSPDLVYHNGGILPTAVTASIFWGTSWAGYSGDKISGMDTFYTGIGGSGYAKTSDEYTETGGTPVTSGISFLGHHVDTTAAPSGAPATSAILGEVCKVIPAGQIASNGYYAVYVDTKRGHANYCAWHSWGSCGGTPIQFGFFFDLDGDAGCDPQDTSTTHSQGLAAIANVSGHELSEARTDPQGTAWFDKQGEENADKCEWSFGSDFVTFSNKTMWKIQGNWSNQAYDGSFGYANLSGQKGCLDGGNYAPIAP